MYVYAKTLKKIISGSIPPYSPKYVTIENIEYKLYSYSMLIHS